MKRTEYNIDSLSSVISSESSLEALMGMISDMGLEIKDIKPAKAQLSPESDLCIVFSRSESEFQCSGSNVLLLPV